MKKILFALITFLGVLSFSGCEKDDICVDGDTPRLIINFHNDSDPETLKKTTALRIIGVGNPEVYHGTGTTSTDRTNLDEVEIPLKLDADSTSFVLINNSAGDPDTGNQDTITITYNRKEVFISRACGYVVQFEDINITVTPDSDNWVKNLETVETIIKPNNSDEVHLKIFH